MQTFWALAHMHVHASNVTVYSVHELNMSEFVNREFGTQILNETLLGWLHDAKMEPEPLRPRKKYRCDAQWVVAGVPIARSSGWLRGVACAAQDGLAEATYEPSAARERDCGHR